MVALTVIKKIKQDLTESFLGWYTMVHTQKYHKLFLAPNANNHEPVSICP